MPATLQPGSKNQITVKLTNHGDAPAAGPVTVGLYASADRSLDDGDALLASATRRVKLKPGKSVSIKLRPQVSSSLATGSYQILAKLDAATLSDSKAENTITAAASPVQVLEPVVDLSATITQLPLQPVSAGTSPERAAVKVTNVGNALAKGKVGVSWFLSSDKTFDTNDTMISSQPAVNLNLNAGKSRTFETSVALPNGFPTGSYFVLARVNAGQGIVDNNADNNIAVGSTPVVVVTVARRRETADHREIVVYSRTEIVSESIGSAFIVTGGTIWLDDGPPMDDDSDIPSQDYTPNPGPPVYVAPPPDDWFPPDTQPTTQPDPTPAPEPMPAPDPIFNDYTSSGGDF
jgi:hypothetical protein